jgi:DNA-binding NarL/FixJ family response regulator
MTNAAIRIAIADDEPLVRAGVRAIFGSEPRFDVVGEAGDGHEAVELMRRHRVDVLLLDIEMPDMDGIATTEWVRRSMPDTRVVILTTFGSDDHLRRCLGAGADGFMLKASSPAELIAGVDAVVAGGAVVSPRVARYLIAPYRNASASPHTPGLDALSTRETGVLRLLSRGHSNAQIAAELHLTEGTVKGYVSAVLLALGVENRVQAALIGYQAGLARERA